MKFIQQNPVFRSEITELATTAGFSVSKRERGQNGAKILFLDMKFKPAKIYPADPLIDKLTVQLKKGEVSYEAYKLRVQDVWIRALNIKKWYVKYSYRNPSTRKFERFKVYEDINRFQGDDKISYSQMLRDAVNLKLNEGFNPFAAEIEVAQVTKAYEEKKAETAVNKSDKRNFTILHALNFFISAKKKQGVSDATMDSYKSTVKFFKNWLNDNRMLLTQAAEISDEHVLTFLSEYAELELPKEIYPPQGKKKWGNKAYNNHMNFIGVVFNFLAERPHKIIKENPLYRPTERETFERKHTAYTDQQLKDILELVRGREDKYMEGLILTVYYACIRSKSEMRAFRAGNVLYERDLIRLDAEGTKGKRDDYIPLDPILKQHFIDQGYDKLPRDWFIFGFKGEPSPIQAGENYYAERFLPYREELQLSDDYTLYGFKHTRVIHLAAAGKSPYELQILLRHTDLEQLMAYLRNLGILIKASVVENSRKL